MQPRLVDCNDGVFVSKRKMAQVRQNRTAGRLFPYGFEVRTQHQLGSVLHY